MQGEVGSLYRHGVEVRDWIRIRDKEYCMDENAVRDRYFLALEAPKAFTKKELEDLRTALGLLNRFDEGDEILDLILEGRYSESFAIFN